MPKEIISTKKAPKAIGPYSQAGKTGNLIVISGQVKSQTNMVIKNKIGLRQLGDQENDIIYMVKKITKKAVLVRNQRFLKKNLKKLITLSWAGRPGPIWIDLPINIQGEKIK